MLYNVCCSGAEGAGYAECRYISLTDAGSVLFLVFDPSFSSESTLPIDPLRCTADELSP
jgi:hypothetical protein